MADTLSSALEKPVNTGLAYELGAPLVPKP